MKTSNNNKITIVGLGYVGMSLGVLLAQHNEVSMLDIDPKRIDKVNNLKSTIGDPDIDEFIKENSLSFCGTLNDEIALKDADYVIISTPTDYDPKSNQFDTSSVDEVVNKALS